ncbi:DNA helicase [Pedobacter lusitanus]|uniref:DNA helicase n=1 Tax=Pedobacter lusitanus TaxID=1503925 RepID=A0A0D0F8Q4_9SPHI|nr:DNA helicase [Pedobacter lusitanus]
MISDFEPAQFNTVFILKHSSGPADITAPGYFNLIPQHISIGYASFEQHNSSIKFPQVDIRLHQNDLILSCRCVAGKNRLCEHQMQVLFNIVERPELRVFFDSRLRHEKIRSFAVAYGLENESPDDLFIIEYGNKSFEITPVIKDLLPVTKERNELLKEFLLPKTALPFLKHYSQEDGIKKILVLKQHRYYSHFQADFLACALTSTGKIRNPLNQLNAMDYIWATEKPEELKFFTAVSRFQQNYETAQADADINGLKALVKNPLNLDVFYHDPNISPNLTVSSIIPVQLKNLHIDIRLAVNLTNGFYTISGELILEEKTYDLKLLNIKFSYFIFYNGTMYLIDNPDFIKVVDFFRQNNNHLVIHESKFGEFKEDILSKLENKIHINYSYLKPATHEQLKETHFDQSTEKIIYLSDSENYVLITPVMRYGAVEVPVLSRKQIHAADHAGNVFTVTRDTATELQFLSSLSRQHPHFEEQLDKDCFYLHRKRFLNEGWFLAAFEEWHQQDITVLGFNQLKNNNINPNKAKINIAVNSGLNWFDTTFEVTFGKQHVPLKHLHRSIRNKSKFVKLGDGTMGILPQEWIDRLTKYFNAGEVVDESVRTPRVNFTEITDLYQEEILSAAVKLELSAYKAKIADFKNIEKVEVPAALNATLRDYQKEGLNWLNFLDEFNFGGCLADDMGLGKTIQIIAFILSQREKTKQNTNLIVVPTTLIFNWQAEIARFAPDIKVHTIYGADRIKDHEDFSGYEIILTSYGTLLYDIAWLKKYFFNYIFLDESQTIKNPDSLRYNAVRLLQSRNKIAITGTPIENNTFDLYGQLSFACPGLLGSKQHFREQYSSPIDKFKDTKAAKNLRKKVSPFILRRTKKEVATELPDKTEMVIYCEMGTAQKKAYDACREEYKQFLQSGKDEHSESHTLHILKGLTQLRQICNSPALLNDNLLHAASSSKIATLMEEIDSHAPQHKILIFSQFVSMLDLIKKELEHKDIPFEYLSGKTTNREKRVESFQKNENIRIFLISLKAGGTGLNLTEADYVYLVDPWWNPAVENQAIDRCYRIGQKKNVVAIRLICPDTIEEKIMKLQETKRGLVSDIIKTDTSLLKSLSKSDLIELFS